MSTRIVLITGANSGVGLATTKVLAGAQDNYHVIMAGRSLDKVRKAMADIDGAGIKGSLSAVHLDVTDKASITQAAKLVEEKHGRLDALVNNAGIACADPNMKTRMQLSMETNVIGPALVAEAFRPLLLKSAKPYSVYVSSGLGSLAMVTNAVPDGFPTYPNLDAYRASKAALNMLMVVEAEDYVGQGLKAFAMCPGFVVSNLRGTSQEDRSGAGFAADPIDSGKLLLSILQGERDKDVGKFVYKDGVYPW